MENLGRTLKVKVEQQDDGCLVTVRLSTGDAKNDLVQSGRFLDRMGESVVMTPAAEPGATSRKVSLSLSGAPIPRRDLTQYRDRDSECLSGHYAGDILMAVRNGISVSSIPFEQRYVPPDPRRRRAEKLTAIELQAGWLEHGAPVETDLGFLADGG